MIGGLYNGKDKPDLGDDVVDGETGAVRRRGFVSRLGHRIVFEDDDREPGLSLATGDGALRIALNGSQTAIEISSDGEISIEGREISLTATAGVTIDAGGGEVTVKGSQIKLN